VLLYLFERGTTHDLGLSEERCWENGWVYAYDVMQWVPALRYRHQSA